MDGAKEGSLGAEKVAVVESGGKYVIRGPKGYLFLKDGYGPLWTDSLVDATRLSKAGAEEFRDWLTS